MQSEALRVGMGLDASRFTDAKSFGERAVTGSPTVITENRLPAIGVNQGFIEMKYLDIGEDCLLDIFLLKGLGTYLNKVVYLCQI